jgi:5,10-methylenetetrahydrofolate reductase
MRDRNWIALQGDLLAANDLGVTHILALTGDPIKMARIPAKGVFEGNSLKLLELIQNFNRGVDLGGEPFKIPPTPITPFGVTGSVIKNRERFKKKIRAKLERGAVGVITQPVYSVEQARSLLDVMEEVWEEMGERKGELILGFFPITSLKTALFLQKGVPGVEVPQSIVEELERANRKGEERKRGVQLSRDLFGQLWELHPKIHFMCANRFELLPEIVGEVKGN